MLPDVFEWLFKHHYCGHTVFFFFWFCYGILQVRNGCYVGLGNSLAVDFVTLELKIWFILVDILV